MRRRALALAGLALALGACRGAPEPAPADETVAPASPRADTAPVAAASPWAAPPPVAPAEPCRPPGDVAPPAFAAAPPTLAAGALADALGDRDHGVSGWEGALVTALDAMPVGARCWLGLSPSAADRRRGRLAPADALAVATDLDCGPGRDGRLGALRPGLFRGASAAALALSRRADGGWAVARDVVDTAGEALGITVDGGSVALAPPRPLDAVGDELVAIAEDAGDACAALARARVADTRRELAAGRCPVARLADHDGLGDPHQAPKLAACAGAAWDVAAYDLLVARQCPLEPLDDAALASLVALWSGRGGAPADLRWVPDSTSELLPPAPARDPVRALAALDALAARRALTAEEQALRLDLLTRVPLGLRDADLDAALDATPRLEVGDPALAIRLLNRGRPADLGKLTDAAGAPSRWPHRAFLATTLAPACAAALGVTAAPAAP